MEQIELRLSHNPYKPETSLVRIIDGVEEVYGETSFLEPVYHGGFYHWLEPYDTWPGFFAATAQAIDTNVFILTFTGVEEDKQLLEKSAKYWERKLGLSIKLRYVPRFMYNHYRDFQYFYFKIVDGTLSDLQEPQIREAFEKLLNNQLNICITAPVSSGKSTLLNALIGRSLLPTSVLPKTAVPTQVAIQPKGQDCSLTSLRKDGQWETWDVPVTQMLLKELNDETDSADCSGKTALRQKMYLKTPAYRYEDEKYDFLRDNPMEVVFTDTPGNNNAWNIQHENTTAQVLDEDTWELILFVFSAEAIEQTDSFAAVQKLLQRVKARGNWEIDQNRLLFVCNRADKLSVSYDKIQHKLRRILQDFDVRDPQVYFTSAYTAELIRSEWYAQQPDADPADWLTKEQMDTKEFLVKKFSANGVPSKNSVTFWVQTAKGKSDKALYHFSSLPKYMQAEFDEIVAQIREKSPDQDVWPEVALLHSGIPALEYAIWDHCSRLAFPMKLWQFQKRMLSHLPDVIQRIQRRLQEIFREIEAVERELYEIEKCLQASEEVLRWIGYIFTQPESEFVFDGEISLDALKSQMETRVQMRKNPMWPLLMNVHRALLYRWMIDGLGDSVYSFIDRLVEQMEKKADDTNRLLTPRGLPELAVGQLRDVPRFQVSVSREQLMRAVRHAMAIHGVFFDTTGLIENICTILSEAARQQQNVSQDQYCLLRCFLRSKAADTEDLQHSLAEEYDFLKKKIDELKQQRERCKEELAMTYRLFEAVEGIQGDLNV